MVLSMLPGPKQVEEAYLGTDGLLTGETGTLHPAYIIDSSTCDPGTSRKLALAANDVHLHPDAASGSLRTTPAVIDAPVSGGVPGAQNATLTFMVRQEQKVEGTSVCRIILQGSSIIITMSTPFSLQCGGNAADVSAVSPLLLKMGKRVIHCGGHGSGHAAKLANNIVLAISMAAVSEGLSFGLRNGLDSKVLTSIFNTSSAHCWSSEKYNPVPGVMDGVPSSRDYKGGFSTSLMLKDLKLALSAGESCRAHMPLTEVCGEMYQGVADLGNSSLDFSAVYRYIYERKDLTE